QRVDAEEVMVGRGGHPHVHVVGCPVIRVGDIVADDVVAAVGGRAADENAAGAAIQAVAGDGVVVDQGSGIAVARDDANRVAVDDAEAGLRIDAVPGSAVAGVVAIVMDQAAQDLVVIDLLGGVGVSSDQDAVLGGVANLAALEPDVVGVEGHLGLVGDLDSVY